MSPIRRAGARWRILVHQMLPRGASGSSHHVSSHPDRDGSCDYTVDADGQTFHVRHTVLDGYDLDEVVVGKFLHLEQMDIGVYWLNIAGVTVWIRADRDARPTAVDVYGPSDYAQPVPGCTYHLTWSDESPSRKPAP